MTNKSLPVDQNRKAIQTLRFGATSTKIAVGAASARAALPTGATSGDVIRVASNTDSYIAFGTVTISATTNDALFTQGVEMIAVPPGATHLASLRVSADGVLTITEVY